MTIVYISVFNFRVSNKTVWTFVRAIDSEGNIGWGESTLEGRHQEVHDSILRLAPELTGGQLAPSIERMNAKPSLDLLTAAAFSGIDQALMDIKARVAGQPLANMLGTVSRNDIPLYANINRGTKDRSPEGFAKRASDAVSDGFTAIKIAPFDNLRMDQSSAETTNRLFEAGMQRIFATRAAIGNGVELMIDCHWRLTEEKTRDLLAELRPIQPYWLECPLPEDAENFGALRNLRNFANNAGIRLAGCETLIGLFGFKPFLDAQIYDVVMPDIKYVGGVDEMRRVGDAAAAKGTACSPHNPSGPVAHAHSLHVSTQLSQFPFLEFQYAESPKFFELAAGELPIPAGGKSELPTGPGLGVSLAIDARGQEHAVGL